MVHSQLQSQIIFGNAQNMQELGDSSVHLVVTSPPYYNAPFDYPGLFETYEEFLDLITKVAEEIHRVLKQGRIAALVVDDVLIKGQKYPVVADVTRIFLQKGFRYRERITWIKPEGYIRISRRSGVLIQHPYPMYYYPDNLQESILIFQKGHFEYKQIPREQKQASQIDVQRYQKEKWYLNVWQITNVLPTSQLEKGIAAFPEELAYRLISLYSYKGEVVLDPFAGSGTTLKVARELGRIAVGYEIDLELIEVIQKKVGAHCSIHIRKDAQRLRSFLQKRVQDKIARKKERRNKKKR